MRTGQGQPPLFADAAIAAALVKALGMTAEQAGGDVGYLAAGMCGLAEDILAAADDRA